MDKSKKPDKQNPRYNANIFSQIIFGWTIRLMFKGCRYGITSNNLTKCLDKDLSEDLGDELEQ